MKTWYVALSVKLMNLFFTQMSEHESTAPVTPQVPKSVPKPVEEGVKPDVIEGGSIFQMPLITKCIIVSLVIILIVVIIAIAVVKHYSNAHSNILQTIKLKDEEIEMSRTKLEEQEQYTNMLNNKCSELSKQLAELNTKSSNTLKNGAMNVPAYNVETVNDQQPASTKSAARTQFKLDDGSVENRTIKETPMQKFQREVINKPRETNMDLIQVAPNQMAPEQILEQQGQQMVMNTIPQRTTLVEQQIPQENDEDVINSIIPTNR